MPARPSFRTSCQWEPGSECPGNLGRVGSDWTELHQAGVLPSAAFGCRRGCDAANSSGTNLGPTSDKLINGIDDDLGHSGRGTRPT